MRRLLEIVALTAALAAAAEMTMTIDQLVSFVQSSVKMHYPDKQVASYLHHVRVKNKLDDRTIEDLEGQGAGPKTIEALRLLRDASATLAAPPPAPPKPKLIGIAVPDSIEQAKIIDEARDYALNYLNQLPNYICVQVTRRYIDPQASANTVSEVYWRLIDTITTKLTYFEHKEDYKVVLVNDQPVNNTSLAALGGTVSAGEFASLMKDIFSAEAQARFGWDHWATLRGRRAYVFSYDIDQAHSRYHIVWEHSLELMPAYRGLIYVDRDTNMIVRITQEPYNIPITFPIHWVKTILDYDFTKIGDNDYLVPMKAVVTSQTAQYQTKNDIEFRLYQKFGTETTIKFGETPAPLPDEKVKEKP